MKKFILYCLLSMSVLAQNITQNETRAEMAKMVFWVGLPWLSGTFLSADFNQDPVQVGAQITSYYKAGFQYPYSGIVNLAFVNWVYKDSKAGLVSTYIAAQMAAEELNRQTNMSKPLTQAVVGGTSLFAAYMLPIPEAIRNHILGYTAAGNLAASLEAESVMQGNSQEQAAIQTALVLLAGSMGTKWTHFDKASAALALEAGFRFFPMLISTDSVRLLLGIPLMFYYSQLGTRERYGLIGQNFLKATGQALCGAVFVKQANDWIKSLLE